jgi:hypothetical protein
MGYSLRADNLSLRCAENELMAQREKKYIITIHLEFK